MRCTQIIGFGVNNPINLDYLNGRVYSYDGMFDEIPLYEYTDNANDEFYREIVQASPWSSGPMLHLAIKRISDGELFNYWKEEEIHYE